VTTFSDRILLRWLPLAVFLAAAAAVALTIGPPRFAYHSWPTPPTSQTVERVVRVKHAPAPATESRPPTVTKQRGAGVWLALSPLAAPSAGRGPARQPASAAPVSPAGRSRSGIGSDRAGRSPHSQGHPTGTPPEGSGSPRGGSPSPSPSQGSSSGIPMAQVNPQRPPAVDAKMSLESRAHVVAAVHVSLEPRSDGTGCPHSDSTGATSSGDGSPNAD
jgi:hypothetical protein